MGRIQALICCALLGSAGSLAVGSQPRRAAAVALYDGARVMAFNHFGQEAAYFQSAQTLIAGSQPTEALASLRGLTLIAARFEQMSDP